MKGAAMNGKERLLEAFARREPDRVPVWEMAFNEESIIKLASFFTTTFDEVRPTDDFEEKINDLPVHHNPQLV
jgi:hypothetical protein